MIFGRVPLVEAEGAILAHSRTLPDRRLKKGTRLGADDLAALHAAGVTEIVAARLEPGDLDEDTAAAAIGDALGGSGIRVAEAATGRSNLYAGSAGLFLPDRAVVDALNAVDPGITLATLAEYEPVEAGRMVATVKIIPLAVSGAAVDAVLALLREKPALRLAPWRPQRVALIQTELPGVKPSVLDKTRRATEARLAPTGSHIVNEQRCPHETAALAALLATPGDADLTLIFGASAVIDQGDVIPAAIEAAGGAVEHLGMPVDPGNLLLLGRLDGRPVLGAPGCARSPKENGFDWVLRRLLADVPVTGADIRGMGVGGLLMEIASRPRPREAESAEADPVVDIIVLAAGKSSRMGGPNKLLATFGGIPLIRRSVETALAARNAGRVRVVVGHMREEIEAALAGLDVDIVPNPAFAAGLSTSLKAGFQASTDADGVLVMLADQPLLGGADLDRLIAAFTGEGKGAIVAATDRGRRRNPVILSIGFADAIAGLTGDVGAAPVIASHPGALTEIEIGAAAGTDVDTPEALAAAGGIVAEVLAN
ncbi:NTP transferase domain-containing protein [Aurantimonas aggregata]|uniref:NTP transferase domain-containing protein n=1 Tax=Aurantimonas aggregata TaxID=2047720 RepID=A0A6L9MBN1_9HYPH|nr:molybdopterin-binding/glycosyltransferase family 2 protein [Aurantimonas aggregata]NDV85157.1 NTP transferase domain-containing protein [Aurantimonas aggregata]